MSSTPWTKETREEILESFKKFAAAHLKYVGTKSKPPRLGEGGRFEDKDDDSDHEDDDSNPEDDDSDQEECSEDEDSNYDGSGGVFFRHYDDDESESDDD